jgi:hypothetical protein
MDDPQYQIARLELKPGDVLVIKMTATRPSLSQIVQIKSDMQRICPGVTCLVLADDVELSVITREEIEQRSTPSLPAKEL